jgi:hypothetical protein
MSIFGGRDCPSILCWWPDSTTMEALTTQALSLPCWPTSCPLGSQSTGAPFLWAASSAPRYQPILIYFEWKGLSGGGRIHWLKHWGFCCFLLFWRHWGYCCFLFFWRHLKILMLLVLLEALYGRQISWWKVTFFLSSFILVLFG